MRRRWRRILFAVIFLFIFGMGGYIFYLNEQYQAMKQAADQMYEPITHSQSDSQTSQASITKRDPITILIMGVGQRKGDKGRSDALIVLSVNPNTGSTLMFSIPKDTRTEIVGKGKEDKISHAYAFGDVKMAVDTTEKFIGVPINYYVKVNMEGFSQIVDTLGGVDVHNTFAFQFDGESFPQGDIHLNGKGALLYAGMRLQDPRGDFGRNDRQRQIVTALIQQLNDPVLLVKLSDKLGNLGTRVKTNIQFDELQAMNQDYRMALDNIHTLSLKGHGTKMDGIYYYIVDPAEREQITNQLKAQLEVK